MQRDLQIEYWSSFTNNTNNTNNKTKKVKYTKPILSFPEFCAAAAVRQAPVSPRMDSAVDGNWTQECTDRNLDQDCRQDNKQGPLQKQAMDEESESLVIPQL